MVVIAIEMDLSAGGGRGGGGGGLEVIVDEESPALSPRSDMTPSPENFPDSSPASPPSQPANTPAFKPVSSPRKQAVTLSSKASAFSIASIIGTSEEDDRRSDVSSTSDTAGSPQPLISTGMASLG